MNAVWSRVYGIDASARKGWSLLSYIWDTDTTSAWNTKEAEHNPLCAENQLVKYVRQLFSQASVKTLPSTYSYSYHTYTKSMFCCCQAVKNTYTSPSEPRTEQRKERSHQQSVFNSVDTTFIPLGNRSEITIS